MYPHAMLKSIIMNGLFAQDMTDDIANVADFMAERLKNLPQNELASRLTLNCTPSHVNSQIIREIPITILNVWDACAISDRVKDELHKCYPQAKLAHLKTGGNFPFLSRSEEVNLHILVKI